MAFTFNAAALAYNLVLLLATVVFRKHLETQVNLSKNLLQTKINNEFTLFTGFSKTVFLKKITVHGLTKHYRTLQILALMMNEIHHSAMITHNEKRSNNFAGMQSRHDSQSKARPRKLGEIYVISDYGCICSDSYCCYYSNYNRRGGSVKENIYYFKKVDYKRRSQR